MGKMGILESMDHTRVLDGQKPGPGDQWVLPAEKGLWMCWSWRGPRGNSQQWLKCGVLPTSLMKIEIGIGTKTEMSRNRCVCMITHSCFAHFPRGRNFCSSHKCGPVWSVPKDREQGKHSRAAESRPTLSVEEGNVSTQFVAAYLGPLSARL